MGKPIVAVSKKNLLGKLFFFCYMVLMEKPEHGCLSWEKGEPKSAKGDNGPSIRVYLLCAISQKSESQNQ